MLCVAQIPPESCTSSSRQCGTRSGVCVIREVPECTEGNFSLGRKFYPFLSSALPVRPCDYGRGARGGDREEVGMVELEERYEDVSENMDHTSPEFYMVGCFTARRQLVK